MKPAHPKPFSPGAVAVRRLLLLVGPGAEAPADSYDAVVCLGGATPRPVGLRFRFNVGSSLADLTKWGALCVLLFPNAVRFDVCGRTKAAAALYSELRGLAAFDGGFEARLLGSAPERAAACKSAHGPSSPSVTV